MPEGALIKECCLRSVSAWPRQEGGGGGGGESKQKGETLESDLEFQSMKWAPWMKNGVERERERAVL